MTCLIQRAVIKTVAYHQTQLHKQIYCIVDCRTAHGKIAFLQLVTQVLYGKAAVQTVDRIQYRKSFGSFTMIPLFQIIGKYLPYLSLYTIFHFFLSKPNNLTKIQLLSIIRYFFTIKMYFNKVQTSFQGFCLNKL